MFGYVKTYAPEMKVAEYEYYRAAYCGLCRSMGKCTGQCSRMTLSYDFAFLALLRIALTDSTVKIEQKRCIAHPLHRRKMIERNDQLDFCAYAASLLTYHKMSDDISDERGAKRALARLSRPILSGGRRRSLRRGGYSELDRAVSEKLSELSAFERSGEPSVDTPADIFGDILANITAHSLVGNEAAIARTLGKHIGRWIYISDAIDDHAEDVKRDRYNPLKLLYGNELTVAQRNLLADALKNELCDAELALDLIDFKDNKILENIIRNVFYLGMPKTVESILANESLDKNDKNCRGRKDNLKNNERSI